MTAWEDPPMKKFALLLVLLIPIQGKGLPLPELSEHLRPESSVRATSPTAATTRAVQVPGYLLDLRSDDVKGSISNLLDDDTSSQVVSNGNEMLLFLLLPYQMRVISLELFVPQTKSRRGPRATVWAGATADKLKAVTADQQTVPGEWLKVRMRGAATGATLLAVLLTSDAARSPIPLGEVRIVARQFKKPKNFESYGAMLDEFLALGVGGQSPESWDTRRGTRMASLLAHWESHPEDMDRLRKDLCASLEGDCTSVATSARDRAGPAAARRRRAGQDPWATFHGWLLSKARKLSASVADETSSDQDFNQLVQERYVAIGIRDAALGTFSYGLANANRTAGVAPSCWFARIDNKPECWGNLAMGQRLHNMAYRVFLKGLERLGEFKLLNELKKPGAVAKNDMSMEGTVTVVAQRWGTEPPYCEQGIPGQGSGERFTVHADSPTVFAYPRAARVPVSLSKPEVTFFFLGPLTITCSLAPFQTVTVKQATHCRQETFHRSWSCDAK